MKSSSKPSSSLPPPERRAERSAVDRAVAVPVAGLVDAHVHVFPPEMIRDRAAYLDRDARFGALHRSPKAPMATVDQVLAHMDETGVAVSVLVGFGFADQGLCRMVNDYLIESVAAHPDRLAGLGCVAPDASGAVAELERCLDAGLRGCGELAPESNSPGLGTVARCLAERDSVLLVHSNEPLGHRYPGKGSYTPEVCFALAQAHPGLSIVFAHMGGGLFLYELMPEVREALADVYYDTAAVPYLYGKDIYEVAVACAGPEKLLFATDYPLLSPMRYMEGLSRLTPADRTAVGGGNSRKVFGL
jgi:predicted TIM-barrel fold metal-dependent hydrolase